MATMMLATFGTTVVTILLVGVSLLLIGLILLQKNRGSGLSGAFGGVGGHTAFGTKTGDFLTWVTVGFTALFLLLSVAGVFIFEPESRTARPTPAAAAPTGAGQAPADEGTAPMTPVETGESSAPKPIELIPMSAPPEGFEPPAKPSEPAPSSNETP